MDDLGREGRVNVNGEVTEGEGEEEAAWERDGKGGIKGEGGGKWEVSKREGEEEMGGEREGKGGE